MTLKERVAELIRNMAAQDNRGTASPYYFVPQSLEAHYSHCEDDAGLGASYVGEIRHGYVLAGERGFWSREDLEKDFDPEGSGYADLDELLDANYIESWQWFVYEDVKDCGIFLTQAEADRWIKANNHNYRQLRTYVRHGFRNEEMKLIIEALTAYATQHDEIFITGEPAPDLSGLAENIKLLSDAK